MKSLRLTWILALSLATSCGKHHRDDVAAPSPQNEVPPEPKPDPTLNESPTNEAHARLRGHLELSSLIEGSLATTKGTFNVGNYLDYHLVGFLGAYDGNPVSPGWRNSDLNTLNTTIYLVAVEGFAKDLAAVCDHGGNPYGISMRPKFKSILEHICSENKVTSDAEMFDMWQGLTARLVAASEFAPWLDFQKSFITDDPKLRIIRLVTSAIINPQLLYKN